jgi:hypothetical protein
MILNRDMMKWMSQFLTPMECKLITKVSYPAKQIAPVEINIFSQY